MSAGTVGRDEWEESHPGMSYEDWHEDQGRGPDSANGDAATVDVDLDALDGQLRNERVGKPTTVRLAGHVLHVLHAGDWSSSAMRAASTGDWDTWAREVIEDDGEYKVWLAADLHNYQIEAVFDECGRQARMNSGKSQRRTGPSRSSRRR